MARIDMPEANEAMMTPGIATADTLFELGMRYCIGHGVPADFVTAHKWFNLAAMKGSADAKQYRCEIAREMSASDIAEAQRQARSWLTLH
ncbi:MAG: hypothetical protein ACKVP5_17355 [Aestuariivirga sp.]